MKLDSLKPIKGSVKNKKELETRPGAGKSAGRGNKGLVNDPFKRRPWFEGADVPSKKTPKRGLPIFLKVNIRLLISPP